VIGRREILSVSAASIFAVGWADRATACRDASWNFGSERDQLEIIVRMLNGQNGSFPASMFDGLGGTNVISSFVGEFRKKTGEMGAKKVELHQFDLLAGDESKKIFLVNLRRDGFDEFIVSCDAGIVGENNYHLVSFEHGRMKTITSVDEFNSFSKVNLHG
jgi:hypothetical protein